MTTRGPIFMYILLALAKPGYGQDLQLRSLIHNQKGISASVVNDLTYTYPFNYYDGFYMTGFCTDTLYFGALIHNPGNGGVFLARYDRYGNELWSKVSGTPSNSGIDMGTAIGIDGNLLYNAGILDPAYPANFDGTILGPGHGGFVAKYSTNGLLQWVRGFEHGIYDLLVDYENLFINHGDSELISLNKQTSETIYSTNITGDNEDKLTHSISFHEGLYSYIALNLGNNISFIGFNGELASSTPIEKPPGAKFSPLVQGLGWSSYGSFYADSGTVVLDGVTYGNMPQSYIYELDIYNEVTSCREVGPYKIHQILPYNDYLYLVCEYDPNDFRMVKVYESTLEQVASYPIFPTRKAMGADQFILGGYHTSPIVAEGLEFQRPNNSDQPNAMMGFLVSSHVGIDEENARGRVSIHPNPSTHVATITSLMDTELYVSNPIGQHLGIIRIRKGANTVDLSSWPAGVLTLRADDGSVIRLMHRAP